MAFGSVADEDYQSIDQREQQYLSARLSGEPVVRFTRILDANMQEPSNELGKSRIAPSYCSVSVMSWLLSVFKLQDTGTVGHGQK